MKIGRRSFDVEPLFVSDSANAVSLLESPEWFLIKPRGVDDGRNPWDWAHYVCKKLTIATGDPVYVEPDLEHQWPYLNREQPESINAKTMDGDCISNGPDVAWPYKKDFAWHLGDDHSQLKTARETVAKTGSASKIRICHIDVGIDPSHMTAPKNINFALARNFVENNNDARDPGRRGILYNPGHGTGTVGILAGNYVEMFDGGSAEKPIFADYLGGAPEAEIVPVRAANSVVHLFTSSMARAIAYAAQPGNSGGNEPSCHVASISMGGLPSRAWAAAVNLAYDRGVVVVAAAGNNFGGFPVRSLVWPARFSRVIAACGVTADKTPYFKAGLHLKMQGNHGPRQAMEHALAAATPNVTWAELGCAKTIDLDGAGTSSATPQVASAAALWMAMHGSGFEPDWRRVEGVRRALFQSADKELPESQKYFGNGVLKAFDALSVSPESFIGELTPAAEDDVRFPFFERLESWSSIDPVTQKMYEVETAQLYSANVRLQEMFPDVESGEVLRGDIQDVVTAIIDLPEVSLTLRRFLMRAQRGGETLYPASIEFAGFTSYRSLVANQKPLLNEPQKESLE
jgi:hypothetical protein